MRNPKLEGSNIVECKPQTGRCPNDCNQCYYNRNKEFRDNAIVTHRDTEKIVRMNTGHDSNIERDFVIRIASRYRHFFFNTAIPRFDFPGPVVFTANPGEENSAVLYRLPPLNLMFVRLRVSATNLEHIRDAVQYYCVENLVPVVLTFMAYYTYVPDGAPNYKWKKRHLNSYWCPKEFFKEDVLRIINNRLVSNCGTLCKDCRNCETYYYQTLKRMACSSQTHQ